MTFNGSTYLGKASESILISRGGERTVGTWIMREQPTLLRDGVMVQTIRALTYSQVETGDEVVDAAGRRWSVIEVQTTSSGRGNPLFDLRVGAI